MVFGISTPGSEDPPEIKYTYQKLRDTVARDAIADMLFYKESLHSHEYTWHKIEEENLPISTLIRYKRRPLTPSLVERIRGKKFTDNDWHILCHLYTKDRDIPDDLTQINYEMRFFNDPTDEKFNKTISAGTYLDVGLLIFKLAKMISITIRENFIELEQTSTLIQNAHWPALMQIAEALENIHNSRESTKRTPRSLAQVPQPHGLCTTP